MLNQPPKERLRIAYAGKMDFWLRKQWSPAPSSAGMKYQESCSAVFTRLDAGCQYCCLPPPPGLAHPAPTLGTPDVPTSTSSLGCTILIPELVRPKTMPKTHPLGRKSTRARQRPNWKAKPWTCACTSKITKYIFKDGTGCSNLVQWHQKYSQYSPWRLMW